MADDRNLRSKNRRKPDQTFKCVQDGENDQTEAKAEAAKEPPEKKSKNKPASDENEDNDGDEKATEIEEAHGSKASKKEGAKSSKEASRDASEEEEVEDGAGDKVTPQESEEAGSKDDGKEKSKSETAKPKAPTETPPAAGEPAKRPLVTDTATVVREKKLAKREHGGPPLSVEEQKLLETDVLTLLKRFTPKYYVPTQKTWAIPKSQLTTQPR